MRIRNMLVVIMALSVVSCASKIKDAYFDLWETVGIEKREILVDRVQDAQETQQEAQEQFSSALEEFSALINFDGGELEDIYHELNEQYEKSDSAARDVSARIDKVESVADSLFREWESELKEISNANLRRDSKRKLESTRQQYVALLKSMRRVESSMPPVLTALKDNVLYLKHNLNANAIGALQGELNNIQRDVSVLIQEMNAAIEQSDMFIASLRA